MAVIELNGKKLKFMTFMEFEPEEETSEALDLPSFEPIQDDKGE